MSGRTSFPLVRALFTAVVAVLVTAGAGGAGGCKSSSSGGQEKFDSFSRTRGNLAAAQQEVDNTLGWISSLRMSDPSALGSNYKQYRNSVDHLAARGEAVERLAIDTREKADQHAQTWEKDVAKIEDPAVRASVEDRRAAVRSNQEQVKARAAEARAAFDTFMKDNRDVLKALSMDLSPAARNSLSPTMDRAVANGKILKQQIAALQRALDNIANGLPPSPAAPAAPAVGSAPAAGNAPAAGKPAAPPAAPPVSTTPAAPAAR